MGAREVGTVIGLWRYPVKSMAAEALDEVEVGWAGFAGDRRWAFVRGDVPRSGFPWMTIRERADMGHYRPSFADPSRPDASRTLVRTPAGDESSFTTGPVPQLGQTVIGSSEKRWIFSNW